MRVPSDPVFFRLVGRAALAAALVLCLLALAVPAPLGPPADPGAPPNPVRSAWFLLWVQELVAHGKGWAWPILVLAAAFLLLPWIAPHRKVSPGAEGADTPARREDDPHTPGTGGTHFRGSRGAAWILLLLFLAIAALTLTAAFFRGENWSWRPPRIARPAHAPTEGR